MSCPLVAVPARARLLLQLFSYPAARLEQFMNASTATDATKRRRTALERAAVGSLDIRDSFWRSSAHTPTVAATSLSLQQEAVLIETSKADIAIASEVWRDMCAASNPLLVQANLNLLPPNFRAAFGLPADAASRLDNVADVQLAVQTALRVARRWLDGQEKAGSCVHLYRL